MNEIHWVRCVNYKGKRVEVEALEMIEKERELQVPFSSQLPAALCQALWSFTLYMCVLVYKRLKGTCVCFGVLFLCSAFLCPMALGCVNLPELQFPSPPLSKPVLCVPSTPRSPDQQCMSVIPFFQGSSFCTARSPLSENRRFICFVQFLLVYG